MGLGDGKGRWINGYHFGGSRVGCLDYRGPGSDRGSIVRDFVDLIVGNGAYEKAPYVCFNLRFRRSNARISPRSSLSNLSARLVGMRRLSLFKVSIATQ